jgi:hypothetical protein
MEIKYLSKSSKEKIKKRSHSRIVNSSEKKFELKHRGSLLLGRGHAEIAAASAVVPYVTEVESVGIWKPTVSMRRAL